MSHPDRSIEQARRKCKWLFDASQILEQLLCRDTFGKIAAIYLIHAVIKIMNEKKRASKLSKEIHVCYLFGYARREHGRDLEEGHEALGNYKTLMLSQTARAGEITNYGRKIGIFFSARV